MPGGDFGVPDGGLRLPAPPSGVSTTSQAAAAAKELRRNQRKLDGNNKRTVTSSKVFRVRITVTCPLTADSVAFDSVANCTAVYDSGVIKVRPSPKGYWTAAADFTINDGTGGVAWAVAAQGVVGSGSGGQSQGTSVIDGGGVEPLTLDTQFEGYLGSTAYPLQVGANALGTDDVGSWTAVVGGHLITEGFPV